MKKFLSLAFLAVVAVAPGQTPGPDPSSAFRPTGQNGRLVVPPWAALVPANGMTVEFWAFLNPGLAAATNTTNGPIAVAKAASNTAYKVRCEHPGGGPLRFEITYRPTPTTATTAEAMSLVALDPNVWRHVAATHDGADLRVYLDGVEIANAPASGPMLEYNTGPLVFGCSPNTPSAETWNGDLDEIRLWNYARSAEEIEGNRFLRIDSAPGLIGAWHFDGTYDDPVGPYDPAPTGAVSMVPSTSPVRQIASLHGVSATTAGSPASFDLRTTLGERPYLFDVSLSGSSPGVPLPPPLLGTLPLNPPLIFTQFGAFLPLELFSGFVGATDGFGRATPALTVPPLPEFVGTQITGAAVLLETGSPYGVRSVTAPWTVAVVPDPPVVFGLAPFHFDATVASSPFVLNGSGFTTLASIRIGGLPCTSVQVLSPTAVSAVAPQLPVGFYDVDVEVLGEIAVRLPDAAVYVLPPSISNVSLWSALPNQPFIVAGTGFSPFDVANVGDVPCVVQYISQYGLMLSTTGPVPCQSQLTVTNPYSGFSDSTVWNRPPTLNGVAGATGPAAGGGPFTVNALPIWSGSTVTVGGAAATVTSLSLTQISCVAPPGTPGGADIVLHCSSGCTVQAGVYVYQ